MVNDSSSENEEQSSPKTPASSRSSRVGRAALSAIGGAIPFAGGLFSAAAGYWSEQEQEKVNDFLKHWMEMLKEELEEKQRTIVEVMARLDMHDEAIQERIKSSEYQSLVKKTFREWAASESERKRILVRNILANAASSSVTSDDVVRMFLDWMKSFSDMHFEVIGAIYNSDGITRGAMWQKIGRGPVREDSADADLFKLLIRDLSMGSVIRQHREVDYHGNFLNKSVRGRPKRPASSTAKSAFDEEDGYELTALGQQFVHYAMNDLSIRIEYDPTAK
ncbi:hypothetical protein [uncultured Roseobacter sp.]|uniref:hypothetical protein n=1 Tax=uncultured Roseobacter sp. TaxID=114847 RepID=UPI00262218AD|nr:hypothetical protein [uncultured Roseobacter sp.]